MEISIKASSLNIMHVTTRRRSQGAMPSRNF